MRSISNAVRPARHKIVNRPIHTRPHHPLQHLVEGHYGNVLAGKYEIRQGDEKRGQDDEYDIPHN